MQLLKQKRISDFPILKEKVDKLNTKLFLCGRWATKYFYHKDCGSLMEIRKSKFFCGIHFCNHPECMVQRFARQCDVFDDISRLNGLRFLWHFSISFPSISLFDFRNNFKELRKRHQYILNKYFEKLRKKGVQIQAVRVADFSFEKDGMVLPHYHFGAIPVGGMRIRGHLILMQSVRKKMIKNMKIKTPFHFESFGLKNKGGVLSYLAKRSAGLYTWKESKNIEYVKSGKGKLLKDIENHKYFTLKDVLSSKQYIKSFYNRSHFVTIGGLPRPVRYGSILMDAIPTHCPKCGLVSPDSVRIEIDFEMQTAEPPDLIKSYPEVVVIYQKV